MWTLAVAAALAGRWDGEPADVTAARVLPVTPEQVTTLLSDWKGWAKILPCASEWEFARVSSGPGARAIARYTIGPWVDGPRTGVIRDVKPGLFVETELEGKKGWFTQVTFREAPNGTEVKLLTPITPPKWPAKGPYYTKSKPAWEACYAGALTAIPAAVR